MSKENSTFDPNNLPNDRVLHVQAETDFELLENGMSPDEIVEVRTVLRKGLGKIKNEDRRAAEEEFSEND